MLLIKAGLITFGLIAAMVLLLTLLLRGRGEKSTSTNPYARNTYSPTNNTNNSNDTEQTKETSPSEEYTPTFKPEENLPPKNINNTNPRDIGAKPKDFDLYKHDKK